MMNKKFLKVLAVAACAVLLVVGSVAGTLAYLSDKTDPITNTFTVGDVNITLTEAYSLAADTKLIPGKTYTKNPTVTVDSGSEQCYLFVEVNNGIAGIEGETTISAQMTTNGWKQLKVNEVAVPNMYYYDGVANTEIKTTYPVFSSFKIAESVTGENMLQYASASITVTAYAVQAEGFGSAEAAWTATFGAPANP